MQICLYPFKIKGKRSIKVPAKNIQYISRETNAYNFKALLIWKGFCV